MRKNGGGKGKEETKLERNDIENLGISTRKGIQEKKKRLEKGGKQA